MSVRSSMGWVRGALVWSLVVALGACGDDGAEAPAEEEHDEGVEVEGCEHMTEGPFESATAGPDDASAPDITAEHTRVDVSLVEVEGGFGGVVTYEAAEDGEYVFFLSRDVALTVADAQGVEVPVEASAPVGLCDEVAVAHTFDLEVGTWFVTFAPGPEATIGVVVEHGEHEE